MRVIHLITSLKIGGAEQLLVNLVCELNQRGIDNQVIFFHDGPHRANLEKLGIKVTHMRGLFCAYDPVFMLRLFWCLLHSRACIVHSSLWSANFLSSIFCKILFIPQVSAVHSVFNKTGVAKNSIFKTFLDRVMLACSKKVVFVSEDMKNQFYNFHPAKLINKKTIVIKNGIKVQDVAEPVDNIIDRAKFTIGAVGRFIPLKNHAILIDAFFELQKKFKDAQLVLIGYGELEDFLKSKVGALGIQDKVIFLKASALPYYQLFDCYVLPSDQEGLSISLLEAMSFGVVPIVANKTKVHDVVKDGENGFLVKAEVDEILLNLEKIYLFPDLRQSLAKNAKLYVTQNFSFGKMVSDYIGVYSNLKK